MKSSFRYFILFLSLVSLNLSSVCSHGAVEKRTVSSNKNCTEAKRKHLAKSRKKTNSPKRQKAYVVMDVHTGQLIDSHNAHKKVYPASLTKMMTLYIAFDHIKAGTLYWHDSVVVSKNAASKPKCNLGLRPGTRMTVRQLILAAAIKSANDAATALGEKIGGTEARFALLMNAKAQELGMTSTSFYNPSGLTNKHQKTTAGDMAKLAQALMLQHGSFYSTFSQKAFTYKGKRHKNTNKLLGTYEGMDGLKTGYTMASGFNLAASAKRGHNRLVGVVIGEDTTHNRFKKMARILNNGFKHMKKRAIQRVALKRKPSPSFISRSDVARKPIRMASKRF